MKRFPSYCYSIRVVLCKHGFSADDEVLIKSLYQSATKLVQTFDENFIISTKNHYLHNAPVTR